MSRDPDPPRRFRPASGVHTRVFDDELVILDMPHGEYLALDAIGSRLWRGLEEGKSVRDVANEIVAEYDVTLEQALADLQELTDDLIGRGLFVIEAAQR